ncbi:MAG: fluoride efflux transporter CrcB [Oscillospiraceae bacterium]
MRKYIFIGCGGFLGAVLRYLVKEMKISGYSGSFPINTLAVNIIGAFILAFILMTAPKTREMDADLRLGITAGLLGAFTTFSTLCKEMAMLMSGGDYLSALLYLAVSTVLGLGAAFLGAAAAGGFGRAKVKEENGELDTLGELSEIESEVE